MTAGRGAAVPEEGEKSMRMPSGEKVHRTTPSRWTVAVLCAGLIAGCGAPIHRSAPPEELLQLATPPSGLEDAQFPQWLRSQRTRVAAERRAAQEHFEQRRMQCWQRFAVNDCITDAREELRGAQAGLRANELRLNQLQRQRRTEQRLRRVEGRAARAG